MSAEREPYMWDAREFVRETADAALARTRTLDGQIRLTLGCSLAQRLAWCPVCGQVHMLAIRCAP